MPTASSRPENWESLTHDLTGILSQPNPITQEETRLFIDRLAQPESFAQMVESLLVSSSLAEHVARHSYRHPLGFDKFVLAPLRPLGQLRLHVWWPEDTREREHIHNHRFGFMSAVLLGEVRTSVYRPAAGDDLTHFSEVGGYREWRFEDLGRGSTALSIAAALAAGSVYAMPADALHRIDATPQLTATLFLETSANRPASSVYVAGGGKPETYVGKELAAQDVRERFTRLLEFV